MNFEKGYDELFKKSMNAFLKNTSDLIFFKDKNLGYICCSLTFANLVQKESNEEFVGKTDYDIFEKELAENYRNDDRQVMESKTSIIDKIEPLPSDDGKKRYSSTSKFVILDDNGEVIGMYGVAKDVTAEIELKQEREERMLSHDLFSDVLEADLTTNKMIKAQGFYSSRFRIKEAVSYAEAVDIFASEFLHADYSQEFKNMYSPEMLMKSFENGVKDFRHIVKASLDRISYIWLELRSRVFFSEISKTIRIATFISDVDDEVKKEQYLKTMARTDSLTGLANRYSVITQIRKCLTGYGLSQKHALLFVDLDNFKNINDEYGHSCGDSILKEVAYELSRICGDGQIVGRVGGDEFLILVKNISSQNDLQQILSQLCGMSIAGNLKLSEKERVTCSIGVAVYEADGKDFSQLYIEADSAMYAAKKNGKNAYAFFKQN